MGTLALGASLLLAGVSSAAELAPSLAARLERAGPEQTLAVIARLDERVDPRDHPEGRARRRELLEALQAVSRRSQAGPLAFLQSRGARVRPLWIVNAIALEAPADLIRELAFTPGIADLRLDVRVRLPPPPPAAGASLRALPAQAGGGPEWNIDATGAPRLWARGVTGAGAVVAFLDTGFDPRHLDLRDRWLATPESWFDVFGQHASPVDLSGHGTRVAGIAVGGAAGGSAIGMAPGARFAFARIFDDQGEADASAVHLGLQWALDPDGDPATDDAPDVVNNSWDLGTSGGECDREFEEDLLALTRAGVAVVFAAGNTGGRPATSTSPANYPDVISVGALERTGAVASFSARGPSACDGASFPDLAAPGVGLRTADEGGADAYVRVSGTSFSAPHVSGALALLLSASPRATAAAAQQALFATASQALSPDNAAGFGALDVAAAYELLLAGLPAGEERDAGAVEPPGGAAGGGRVADGGSPPASRGSGCGCGSALVPAGLLVAGALGATAARGRLARLLGGRGRLRRLAWVLGAVALLMAMAWLWRMALDDAGMGAAPASAPAPQGASAAGGQDAGLQPERPR